MQMKRELARAGAALSMLSAVMMPELALADRFVNQVYLQLVALGGGSLPNDSFVGKIVRGRSEVLTAVLDAGREYLIVGVCDEDCTDVDLALYDENGHLIERDDEYDDTPMVAVTPAWTGPFYLEITVPSCHAWRCTVGVGVFDGRAV